MTAGPLLLLGALHLVMAWWIWRAHHNSRVHRLFAGQILAQGAWTLGNAALQAGVWLGVAKALSFGAGSVIPATFLLFTVHYPAPRQGCTPLLAKLAAVGAGLFTIASVFTDWIVYDVRLTAIGPMRQAGPLYPVFTLYVVVVSCAGLAVFAKKHRRTSGRQRAELNYYGFGMLVLATGGLLTNLLIPALTGRSNLSHIGPYFGLALLFLTAHSIIRNRFMDLRVVLHGSLSLALATLMCLIGVGLVFVTVWPHSVSNLSVREFAFAATALVAGGLLVPITRDAASRLLDHYLYPTHSNPQRLLREASSQLTQALDLAHLLPVVLRTMHAMVRPDGVAVYLRERDSLRLAGSEAGGDAAFATPQLMPLRVCVTAREAAGPLVRDELSDASGLRTALGAMHWALVIPLRSDGILVGAVSLGDKHSGDPYFSQDLDALATLGNHAASALQKGQLYAEVVLANQYVSKIVTTMQNGVIAVDVAGDVMLANPAGHTLLGLDKPPIRVEDVPGAIKDLLLATAEDRQALTSPREITLQVEGAPRWLLITPAVLRDHAAATIGAVAVFSDLTPLKELNRERARSERMANMQVMTQALAHEIGNALAPVKILARLLPERHSDAEFADKFARIVGREVERMEQMIARLRRIAPRGDLVYTRLDLRGPIRHAIDVVSATAAERSVTVTADLTETSTFVFGDESELEEVFVNILTNALEAIAPTEAPHPGYIQVSLTTAAGYAVTSIEDSGPGVKPEMREQIFEPFVSSKGRGSGLGLAICAGMVSRHGGRISVENRSEVGAVFSIQLPLHVKAPDPVPPPQ